MTNFDDFVADADAEEERRKKRLEKEERIEEADNHIPEEQVDPEPTARVKVVRNTLVKCSNCGNIFDTTSLTGRYCPKCGTEGFVEPSETPESTKHSSHVAIQTVKTGRVNGKDESVIFQLTHPYNNQYR
jgi:DNA-directed RNA polymerase subunit RPC12/RpoP